MARLAQLMASPALVDPRCDQPCGAALCTKQVVIDLLDAEAFEEGQGRAALLICRVGQHHKQRLVQMPSGCHEVHLPDDPLGPAHDKYDRLRLGSEARDGVLPGVVLEVAARRAIGRRCLPG